MTVTVNLKDGRSLHARCDRPHGRWDHPLSREELLFKFYDCACRVLRRADVEQVVGLIESLEKAEDVSGLMGLMVGDERAV